MASLSNNTIGSTYQGLLKTSDNGDLSGNTGTGAIGVTDGIGTSTILYLSQDRVGIGDATPNAILEVRGTSSQFLLSYDDANYASISVASAGETTLTTGGTSHKFNLISSIIDLEASTRCEVDGVFYVGNSGAGHDVKFWGAHADKNVTWDASEHKLTFGTSGEQSIDTIWYTDDSDKYITIDGDDIRLRDSNRLLFGNSVDFTIQHASGNTSLLNLTGGLNINNTGGAVTIQAAVSGGATTIGHGTSETTIGDNLTITGVASVGGLLTATGGVKLGNNTIYASDGGIALGISGGDNLIITGDLTIGGGNILNSITFDYGATMNDTLSMGTEQLRVQNIRDNSGTSNMTLSGSNLVLTGDMEILGNTLTFGGSGANGNFTGSASEMTLTEVNDFRLIAASGQNAEILLECDAGAADADTWVIRSQHTNNTLAFRNDSSSGYAMSLSATGSLSVIGDLILTGNTIYSSTTAALELSGANVQVVGDLTVTGNDIKGSGGTVITMDGSNNATITGDLTITGADIVLGADADDTDRTIVFGHSTLKTIMGIDDSADAFVINTDGAFAGTLANNSLTIDASHNLSIAGDLRVIGGKIYDVQTIYNSDDESSITIDADRNVSCLQQLLVSGNVTAGANLQVIGYFAANNKTPAAAPNYTVSNLSTDRNLDCDSTNDAEVADVLGQVITDLIAVGIFQ